LVEFKKVVPHARIPKYAHVSDCGADLYAVNRVFIFSGAVGKIPLGIATAFSPDYYATLEDRSSRANKGLFVVGGQIDADYRGQWFCMLYNSTQYCQKIETGDKICQVIFHRRNKAIFIGVDSLDDTERGEGGFGSTDDER